MLHFIAWDFVGGRELWKSDGTEAGTVRLTDIQPGMAGSVDRLLAGAGSSVYFFGPGAGGKSALWKFDGTAAAPVELGALTPPGDRPGVFASAGNTLFFAAEGQGLGLEPWKTDGTPAGTVLLRDVEAGGTSGSPQHLSDMGGAVLFSVAGPEGQELGRSDGTEAGTRLVRGGFTAINSWRTHLGGVLYFNATTAESGAELWRSDGTPEGTFLVKDIEPGAKSSFPAALTRRGGALFFSARTSTHGYELWKSDGTPEGTVQVKDIHPGTGNSMGDAPMLDLGGTLYPGAGYGFPRSLTDMEGTLVFTAAYELTSDRRGLWRLDAAGTPQRVTLSAPGAGAVDPLGGLTVYLVKIYLPGIAETEKPTPRSPHKES